MKLPEPLVEGRLIKRYKRFLADIELPDGSTVTAHCPNSGSMEGLKNPGSAVILSKPAGKNRKLAYTLELVKVGRYWVGVNTARPNYIVEEAIAARKVPELEGYVSVRREVKYGQNSRIDLLLEGPRGLCYVEVKNTTLAVGKRACFPDAVTTRGQKHLAELSAMVREGHRAVMFYLVNRGDCREMGPADHIDPDYGRMLREAHAAGVELLAYRAQVSPTAIRVQTSLPVVLEDSLLEPA